MLEPPQNAYLSPEGLDAWAIDTNGHPFNAETKEELVEYMDVTEDGYLTQVFPHSAFNLRKELTPPRSHNPEYRILQPYSFKGFLQVYQLQTENDEEETWKDLVRASSLFFLIFYSKS